MTADLTDMMTDVVNISIMKTLQANKLTSFLFIIAGDLLNIPSLPLLFKSA